MEFLSFLLGGLARSARATPSQVAGDGLYSAGHLRRSVIDLIPKTNIGSGSRRFGKLERERRCHRAICESRGYVFGCLSDDVMDIRRLELSGMAADLLDPPKFELESYIANYTGKSLFALPKISD